MVRFTLALAGRAQLTMYLSTLRASGSVRALAVRALAVRALAVRALAVSALAVSALAVSALAVRALAVRALSDSAAWVAVPTRSSSSPAPWRQPVRERVAAITSEVRERVFTMM